VVDYAADSGFFPLRGEVGRGTARTAAGAVYDAGRSGEAGCAGDRVQYGLDAVAQCASIRAKVSVPVVGTVLPIEPAAEQTPTGVMGILATPGTVRRADPTMPNWNGSLRRERS